MKNKIIKKRIKLIIVEQTREDCEGNWIQVEDEPGECISWEPDTETPGRGDRGIGGGQCWDPKKKQWRDGEVDADGSCVGPARGAGARRISINVGPDKPTPDPNVRAKAKAKAKEKEARDKAAKVKAKEKEARDKAAKAKEKEEAAKAKEKEARDKAAKAKEKEVRTRTGPGRRDVREPGRSRRSRFLDPDYSGEE